MALNNCGMFPPLKIRCLVIQFSHQEGILQSLIALRAAQQLYPELEIHFIVQESDSGAAQRAPWLKSVIEFPTKSILAPFLQASETAELDYTRLQQWIAPLVQQTWDLVVNWSYSEASSYLTGLIPARWYLGYTRRHDGNFELLGSDGWTHYIQAVVQSRIPQNIHWVDILTTQLLTLLQLRFGEPHPHTSPGPAFFSLKLTRAEQQEHLSALRKNWVALQLGPEKTGQTQNRHSWGPHQWAELIKKILSSHMDYGVFLLGSKTEIKQYNLLLRDLGSFLEGRTAFIPLVGDIDFDLWASVINRSEWLIAEDASAIHLAGAVGTRIVNISSGPASYLEKGPYGNGHYVITSNQNRPFEGVSVNAVYALWSEVIAQQPPVENTPFTLEEHRFPWGWKDIEVYQSRIRQPQEGGGVVYEPIVTQSLSIERWTAMTLGHIARAWYCGWVPPVGREITRESLDPALIQFLRRTQNALHILTQIAEQAKLTAIRLQHLSARLKSGRMMVVQDQTELQSLRETLLEFEKLLERLTQNHVGLFAFWQFHRVSMHHLGTAHLGKMGEKTAQFYQQLLEGISIFKEWITFTLDLAKPVLVHVPCPSESRQDVFSTFGNA